MNKNHFKTSVNKVRRFLFGMKFTDGFILKFLIYFLLVVVGFVFIYPLLIMVSYSLMSLEDLLNPMVFQVPSAIYFENYATAWRALDYLSVFFMRPILRKKLIPEEKNFTHHSFIGKKDIVIDEIKENEKG